jgi:GT2 family glycosyltransferase
VADDPADPFARLLLRGRTRRKAPHPLFDPEAWVRRHPEAARHRFGPFGHFTATATPATELPLPEPLDRGTGDHTWGVVRRGLDQALDRWLAGERLRLAVRPVEGFDAALGARTVARWAPAALAAHPDPAAPVVTVVMPVRDRERLVGEAIASVRAQTLQAWELVVVDDGSADGTANVVRSAAGGRPADPPRLALGRGRLRGAQRRRRRRPRPLRRLAGLRQRLGAGLPGDDGRGPGRRRAGRLRGLRPGRRPVPRARPGTPERARELLAVSNVVDLNVLAVTRELLAEAGGFDESLRRTVDYDLVLRLAERVPLTYVPFVGVRYRDDRAAPDRISVREPITWREVVKNRRLVAWDRLAAGAGSRAPGRVSVLVGATRGWEGAYASATAALAAEADRRQDADAGLEVVVVDDALPRADGLVLASLELADPRVRVTRTPKGGDRALATNLAFERSRGATVVALAEGVQLWPGWREPLLAALADGAAAAQPLVVAADGTVASAGATWPPDAALPGPVLAGLSADDARRAGARLEVRAAADAAVAVPAAAYAAVRGLDPLYAGAHELTDLSLRLAARPGPAGRASSPRPRRPRSPRSRCRPAADDALFAGRWPPRPPPAPTSGPRPGSPSRGRRPARRWSARCPIGRRAPGRRPALRWAIKIGAPWSAGRAAVGRPALRALAGGALERLGQQVVIDHRPALQRDHRGLDDVVLTLRGLFPVTPPPDTASLLWVISHPDLVTPAEAAAYDRVFAASALWATRFGAASGLAVEPLLQATDPVRFHPDPAVADTGEPVLFVGNSRGVYRPVVRDLLAAGVDVGIHGADWERFGAGGPRAVAAAGERRRPRALPRGRRRPQRPLGRHARGRLLVEPLFDAAACGARVVSDHIAGPRPCSTGWSTPTGRRPSWWRWSPARRTCSRPRRSARTSAAGSARSTRSTSAREPS